MDNKNKKVTKTTTKKTTTTKKATTTKKPAVKKTTTKKVEPRVVKEEVVPVVPNLNMVKCVHCHKEFEKGYTICPHCHKRQKPSISLTFFIVFAVVFVFTIFCIHFVKKYVIKTNNQEDYKAQCILVDYESLVRHPKDYKGKKVKLIGKIIDVTGYDDGFTNNMELIVDINQFEDGNNELITVIFSDKYNQGFINGDIITIYGDYTSINGNNPEITARYIIYGK